MTAYQKIVAAYPLTYEMWVLCEIELMMGMGDAVRRARLGRARKYLTSRMERP